VGDLMLRAKRTVSKWLHERDKRRALWMFGGIQICPWCKQWVQLHDGWHFDSKTDPDIDALHCGNCGGVSRWRFEVGMIPLDPIGLTPPPVVCIQAKPRTPPMTKTYAMSREVPDDAREYLTPGKPYEVRKERDKGFDFECDLGVKRFAAWEDSGHLDGADWTRLTEAEALAIMIEQAAGGTQVIDEWDRMDAEVQARLDALAPTIAVPADLCDNVADEVVKQLLIYDGRNPDTYDSEIMVRVDVARDIVVRVLSTRIKEAGL